MSDKKIFKVGDVVILDPEAALNITEPKDTLSYDTHYTVTNIIKYKNLEDIVTGDLLVLDINRDWEFYKERFKLVEDLNYTPIAYSKKRTILIL